MGVNNPEFWNKQRVDNYTARINAKRATPAEVRRHEAAMELTDTMSPMPGAEDQGIGHMEVEIGEAHFLTMMTRDLGRQHDRPMKALDLGTFTGASAGAIAKGMEESGGKVITVSIDAKYNDIANQYWREEGVADRVDHWVLPLNGYKYGGAAQLMDELVEKPDELGTYDIIFIDADKPGYEHYYEQAVKLLRPGGKVVLDNMLWSGRVTDPEMHDPRGDDHLRNLNDKIIKDPRVDAVLLNADDGIMIAEKRGYVRKRNQSPAETAPQR